VAAVVADSDAGDVSVVNQAPFGLFPEHPATDGAAGTTDQNLVSSGRNPALATLRREARQADRPPVSHSRHGRL
jgi:hypothetical protein